MTLTTYRNYQELFQNLVLYYDLSPRGINGTVACDFSNVGTNNGTIYTPNTADADRFGRSSRAMGFRRSSSYYINVPTGVMPSGTTGFAAFAWVNFAALDGTGQYVFILSNSAGYKIIAMGPIYSTRFTIYYNESTTVSHSIALPTSTWMQLGIAWDGVGNTLKHYINGVVVKSTASAALSVSLPSSSSYSQIGTYMNHTEGHFSGSMQEVMMFVTSDASGVAISPERAKSLYDLTLKKSITSIMSGVRGVQ